MRNILYKFTLLINVTLNPIQHTVKFQHQIAKLVITLQCRNTNRALRLLIDNINGIGN